MIPSKKYLIAIILIFILGCNNEVKKPVKTPEAPVTGTIEGTVMDSITRKVIKGATVEMVNTKISCSTDEKGRYELSNFPGSMVILVTKEGYKDNSKTVFINGGDHIKENILLIPNQASVTPQAVVKAPTTILSTSYYSNEVVAIDLEKEIIKETIPVGKDPQGLGISCEYSTVYVANSGDNTVTLLNFSKELTLTGHISVEKKPASVVTTKNFVYVANSDSDNVSVIDIKENKQVGTINTGKMPVSLCFDDKEGLLYVLNGRSNNVSVIDTGSNTIIKTIETEEFPCSGAVSSEYLFVVNQVSCSLSVINKKTGEKSSIKIGKSPKRCLFLPEGNKLYVTNYQDDNLSVIDCKEQKVIKTIDIGKNPTGMVLWQEKKRLYVANGGSNTISIIDIMTDQPVKEIPAGNFPYDLILIK